MNAEVAIIPALAGPTKWPDERTRPRLELVSYISATCNPDPGCKMRYAAKCARHGAFLGALPLLFGFFGIEFQLAKLLHKLIERAHKRPPGGLGRCWKGRSIFIAQKAAHGRLLSTAKQLISLQLKRELCNYRIAGEVPKARHGALFPPFSAPFLRCFCTVLSALAALMAARARARGLYSLRRRRSSRPRTSPSSERPRGPAASAGRWCGT